MYGGTTRSNALARARVRPSPRRRPRPLRAARSRSRGELGRSARRRQEDGCCCSRLSTLPARCAVGRRRAAIRSPQRQPVPGAPRRRRRWFPRSTTGRCSSRPRRAWSWARSGTRRRCSARDGRSSRTSTWTGPARAPSVPIIVTVIVSFITAWVLAGASSIAWHFYGGSCLWGAVVHGVDPVGGLHRRALHHARRVRGPADVADGAEHRARARDGRS